MTNQPQKMPTLSSSEDITIELTTRPVHRLWFGREKTDKKFGILGIPGFCKALKIMEHSIREDDPYADYHYYQIDQGLDDLAFDLDTQLKDIKNYIDENLPRGMNLPEVVSNNPEVVPVKFASKLGFKMVYQLLKVDEIVMKTLQANHIGLLPNKDKFETIAKLEKRVRAVIHKVFDFRHTGVSRDDMAANNQKALIAKKEMGEIAIEFLEGKTRSENAPSLPSRRIKVASNIKKGDVDPDENELDKVLDDALAN